MSYSKTSVDFVVNGKRYIFGTVTQVQKTEEETGSVKFQPKLNLVWNRFTYASMFEPLRLSVPLTPELINSIKDVISNPDPRAKVTIGKALSVYKNKSLYLNSANTVVKLYSSEEILEGLKLCEILESILKWMDDVSYTVGDPYQETIEHLNYNEDLVLLKTAHPFNLSFITREYFTPPDEKSGDRIILISGKQKFTFHRIPEPVEEAKKKLNARFEQFLETFKDIKNKLDTNDICYLQNTVPVRFVSWENWQDRFGNKVQTLSLLDQTTMQYLTIPVDVNIMSKIIDKLESVK